MTAARTRLLTLAAAAALCGGCASVPPITPVEAKINPAELVDWTSEADTRLLSSTTSLYQVAERVRLEQKPAVLPPKRSVLILSGGGAYGAYSAGVLIGWTQSGKRPSFDVVTGISTGALIAPLAFLGPEYDSQLRTMYTTIRQEDLFRIRKNLRSLFGESLADNSPLIQKLQEMVTPQLLSAIAAEHRKGRRLYVGTTDLDGRRQVIWDMGAIAEHGTAQDLALFQNVILASAAIPGFFPPVRIPVTIDGKLYEERHVDGGVSASLFFKPPWVSPEKRSDPNATSLYDSDVYVLVAGKLYADPELVKPRSLRIAGASVSALIYAQTRGDLFNLYAACAFTGMNYHVTAVPASVVITSASTDFDPVDMAKLFQEGVKQVSEGTVWRRTPPGLERGEGVSQRAGGRLTREPGEAKQQPILEQKFDPSLAPTGKRGIPGTVPLR